MSPASRAEPRHSDERFAQVVRLRYESFGRNEQRGGRVTGSEGGAVPETRRQPPQDPRARYTVGSVVRALRLLDVVAQGPAEGLTVSELARTLGTSKSTAFAL